MNRIKVLIVDDSAVMRKALTDALSRSSMIEVVGTAIDPYIAVTKIQKLNPDVMTLDIEMPRMDGITFLSKLMVSHPMPVIMVSALTEEGAAKTIEALQKGAVDFVLKPRLDDPQSWDRFSEELLEKVTGAVGSKIKRRILTRPEPMPAPPPSAPAGMRVEQKYTADVILPKAVKPVRNEVSDTIIAIGASTGGTEVIAEILSNLPETVPGIVIVQHMPEKFTEAFANRVNTMSRLYVKEAETGDRANKGMALIAPGNRHMLLKNDGRGYYVEINDGLPVNRHRPSVDVLFRSVAQYAGKKSIGILLTGMGADGAAGLLEMNENGSVTIAQDEASSVVFGMPREAIKLGAADMVKNIKEIIAYINSL
jgi:two-component system chemotaxis response regulator CheB